MKERLKVFLNKIGNKNWYFFKGFLIFIQLKTFQNNNNQIFELTIRLGFEISNSWTDLSKRNFKLGHPGAKDKSDTINNNLRNKVCKYTVGVPGVYRYMLKRKYSYGYKKLPYKSSIKIKTNTFNFGNDNHPPTEVLIYIDKSKINNDSNPYSNYKYN